MLVRITTLICLVCVVAGQRQDRANHKSKLLTNNEFKQLASLTDEAYFKRVLNNILVPRVVGTPGHEKVKDFIAREMSSLGWLVSLHSFDAHTPIFGRLPFTNVIAELSPFNHTRQLALACHYDSKYFEDFTFYAATDSAVPCAMLVHLAKVLTPYLSPQDIGVKLIFFDGEEAFHQWTKTDSLYGSRQLAAKWEGESFPHASRSEYTQLDRLDMLVLLDLIGTKDQQFYSYFGATEKWHRLLSKIEKQLKVMKVIPSNQPLHFLEKSIRAGIEDDHIPFLKREVPVLHLIPPIFPEVWHTAGDNYDALDFPTIDTLNKVLQVFVYVYVH